MRQIELGTKEFYEVLEIFESMKLVRGRYDREDKECWKNRAYYQDGEVNFAFTMFLSGCNYGVSLCGNV